MMWAGLRWVWLATAAFAALLIAANAHLAYVAFASQPVCIAHSVADGGLQAAGYAAAVSSC